MPNVLFRDFSISEPGMAHEAAGESSPGVVVRVHSEATGAHRDKLRDFFDGLVRLSDTDVRAVEAVVSRLVNAEAEEAGKAVDALLDEDNRRIRDRFIAEWSPLRRDDVLRLARQTGSDGETILQQWEAERMVFFVEHRDKTYYPSFQFRGGLPDPTVKVIVDALPPELSDWQRAFWFVSANGWVNDQSPVAHLDDFDLLLKAARYEGEPVVG